MGRRSSKAQAKATSSPFGDEHQFQPQQHPSRSDQKRPSFGQGGDAFEHPEEVSPKSDSTSSIQQQLVDIPTPSDDMPNSKKENKGMTPSNSQFFSEHYSPAVSNDGHMSDADVAPAAYSSTKEMRSPSYATDVIPQDSPTNIGGPSSSKRDDDRLYASRPGLGRVASDQPLMGDISGANTPVDGLKPNPFDQDELSPASAQSSGESSPELVAIRGSHLVPKIHLNSNPTSPDPAHVASFEPRPSFAAPFNDDEEEINPVRTTPVAADRGKKTVSIAASSVQFDTQKYTDANPNSIAARRSMRMKTQQDRLSGVSKKSGGSDGKKEKNGQSTNRKPFQSTRLKGEIYKPWLDKRDPAQRWAKYITLASIVIGIGAAAALCYDGYRAVPQLGKTCLVLQDNFDTLNLDTWQREVRLDGYDNGEFQWTTDSDNNSFVDNGILYLTPTLTSDHLGEEAINNGYTLNLTQDGTCTSNNVSQCVAVSNTSKLTVINPVMSARLITKNTVSIKYGKVEVKAKFPTGDWLWPSIFMLPVNETYGKWPRSGEIDLVTGRGNNASYPTRGVDYAQSSLHWGPNPELDRLWMTWGYREQRRTYYNQEWHTYGFEWNEEYLWTYIDSRVAQVISLRFKESFWKKGNFPTTVTNTTTGEIQRLTNPWISSENNVAPFDQPFYLILNLAVGATNGWFPDGEGGKPWIDNSGTAMTDFWAAKDRWWNNWPSDKKERGFAIDSVKMWKTC